MHESFFKLVSPETESQHLPAWVLGLRDCIDDDPGTLCTRQLPGNGKGKGPSANGQKAIHKADAQKLMRDHIGAVVSHFPQIDTWDVVNEAVADNWPASLSGWEASLRTNVWQLAFGGGKYVSQAFKSAKEEIGSAAGVRLFYNDYVDDDSCGGASAINHLKADAIYSMLTALLNDQTPIDGIGLQTHVSLQKLQYLAAQQGASFDTIVENFGNELRAQIDRFRGLRTFGSQPLAVQITELDVRGASTSADHNQAAKIYSTVVAACKDRCSGITFWGMTDGHSWIPESYGVPSPGCTVPASTPRLLFTNYTPTESYYSVHQALRTP